MKNTTLFLILASSFLTLTSSAAQKLTYVQRYNLLLTKNYKKVEENFHNKYIEKKAKERNSLSQKYKSITQRLTKNPNSKTLLDEKELIEKKLSVLYIYQDFYKTIKKIYKAKYVSRNRNDLKVAADQQEKLLEKHEKLTTEPFPPYELEVIQKLMKKK